MSEMNEGLVYIWDKDIGFSYMFIYNCKPLIKAVLKVCDTCRVPLREHEFLSYILIWDWEEKGVIFFLPFKTPWLLYLGAENWFLLLRWDWGFELK